MELPHLLQVERVAVGVSEQRVAVVVSETLLDDEVFEGVHDAEVEDLEEIVEHTGRTLVGDQFVDALDDARVVLQRNGRVERHRIGVVDQLQRLEVVEVTGHVGLQVLLEHALLCDEQHAHAQEPFVDVRLVAVGVVVVDTEHHAARLFVDLNEVAAQVLVGRLGDVEQFVRLGGPRHVRVDAVTAQMVQVLVGVGLVLLLGPQALEESEILEFDAVGVRQPVDGHRHVDVGVVRVVDELRLGGAGRRQTEQSPIVVVRFTVFGLPVVDHVVGLGGDDGVANRRIDEPFVGDGLQQVVFVGVELLQHLFVEAQHGVERQNAETRSHVGFGVDADVGRFERVGVERILPHEAQRDRHQLFGERPQADGSIGHWTHLLSEVRIGLCRCFRSGISDDFSDISYLGHRERILRKEWSTCQR